MFKRKFHMTRPDFFLLEATIMENMERNGYNHEKHNSFATRSSGSSISLELRLYITLRILSGASYLDMIWYGVEVRSVPGILENYFVISMKRWTILTSPLTRLVFVK
jgi:hypothetical protein